MIYRKLNDEKNWQVTCSVSIGNSWISVWQQSGGVRAKIKNNKITTSLY